MIINIAPGTFGGALRNGDMIGLLNVVGHFRKGNPDVKLHMMEGTISSADYCQKMFQFLLEETDYFSLVPGEHQLPWKKVNLWDFRDISGDVGVIPNNKAMEKKIVIFPLFDAPYNVYRNWPADLLDFLVDQYNQPKYEGYTKLICMQNALEKQYDGWEYSTDFKENLYHIMTAETFIGAETGSAVFASALARPPEELIYYYSSRGLLHTTPFNLLRGHGEMRTYWLDFEGTTWQ